MGSLPTTYDDFTSLVRRVRSNISHPEVVTSVALLVEHSDGRRLDIRVRAGTPPATKELIQREAREAVAASSFSGVEVPLPYTPEPDDEYLPASEKVPQNVEELNLGARAMDSSDPIKAGMSAASVEMCRGKGTAGWLFELNTKVVALGNWHVLCAQGNQSTIGTDPVWLKCKPRQPSNAVLHHFVRLNPNKPQRLDFALARFSDEQQARGGMAHCDGDAPVDLYRLDPEPGGRQTFKADGQFSQCTGGARLIGTIDLKLFDEFPLEGQLVFERLLVGGDSGAVIVDEATNTVIGLFCIFSSKHSVACPIGVELRNTWTKIGERQTKDGKIPIFEGNLP